MSENRDPIGRGNQAADARAQPAHDSGGDKPGVAAAARLVERAREADDSQPRQVLMQRVIALSGVIEISDKAERPHDPGAPAEAPTKIGISPAHDPPMDLSKTALEWGGRPMPARAQVAADELRLSVSELERAKDHVDAQWATYSSIDLQLCEDTRLPQRLLSSSIEDAVTQQYNPGALTAGSPSHDRRPERVLDAASVPELGLVTKLRDAGAARAPAAAQKASREPRMLVVPAFVAWTVAGAFSVCALALAYLVATFLACGHPSLFDPLGLRCRDRADVAKAR